MHHKWVPFSGVHFMLLHPEIHYQVLYVLFSKSQGPTFDLPRHLRGDLPGLSHFQERRVAGMEDLLPPYPTLPPAP